MLTPGDGYRPELLAAVSYMEMTASLVLGGTPNAELFVGPTSDILLMWSRMEKYANYIRQDLNLSGFLINVEKVAQSMPIEVERIRGIDESNSRCQFAREAEIYLQSGWGRSDLEQKAILHDYEAVCLNTSHNFHFGSVLGQTFQ